MRNLLALIGLLVVGFAAVGWYCGWYKLNVGKGTDGNLQIETEVKTKKVVEDSSSFFEKLTKIATDQMDKKGQQPTSTPVGIPGPGTAPTAKEKDTFQGGWLLSPEKVSQPTAGIR